MFGLFVGLSYQRSRLTAWLCKVQPLCLSAREHPWVLLAKAGWEVEGVPPAHPPSSSHPALAGSAGGNPQADDKYLYSSCSHLTGLKEAGKARNCPAASPCHPEQEGNQTPQGRCRQGCCSHAPAMALGCMRVPCHLPPLPVLCVFGSDGIPNTPCPQGMWLLDMGLLLPALKSPI